MTTTLWRIVAAGLVGFIMFLITQFAGVAPEGFNPATWALVGAVTTFFGNLAIKALDNLKSSTATKRQ